MSLIEEYTKYSMCEKDSERLVALSALGAQPESRIRDVALWYAMLQIPAKKERSRLGYGVRMTRRPGATWALLSTLLADSDHEIIGDAINAMTFSKNRALAHRLYSLTFAPEKPQRVFYCVARFSEEATDRRFAERLAVGLDLEVSDAMQARAFNAMFHLGFKDRDAIRVALQLVSSHVNATNMDRKAAVAAILYLCFAGDRDDIQKLMDIRDSVSIPELRRLLSWGLQEVSSIGRNAFSAEDAIVFFERAKPHREPNFSGYGCFLQKDLTAGFDLFLEKQPPENRSKIVRLVLNLGNAECIDKVARHSVFGIQKAVADQDAASLEYWRVYCPSHSLEFISSICDPLMYEAWHRKDPELLYSSFSVADWFGNKPKCKQWRVLFDKSLTTDLSLALDIFVAQFLSVEREFCFSAEKNAPAADLIKALFEGAEKILKAAIASKSSHASKGFVETLYALLIGSVLPANDVAAFAKVVGVPQQTWVPAALGVTAASWNEQCRKDFAKTLLEGIDAPVQDFDCPQSEYILQISAYILASLNVADSVNLGDEYFSKLNIICHKIQAILDALSEHGDDAGDGDDDVADWAGHVASDKPIARWMAVASVCSGKNWTEAEILQFEQVLKESMRVAPHVEKRWVIRALVRLNTDDSIKAILYQAFQHVDAEFVGHTIRELLKSKHSRAQQALIRSIGRNTVSDDIKLLILDEITIDNPMEVMRELKTLELLRLPQHIDDAIRDAVGRVAALIDKAELDASDSVREHASIQDVDSIVSELLPHGASLSVDARSALRTAEMILIQSQAWGKDAVDLSPIVNMHCKAVELALREIMEPWTDAVMRKGILSRKLDIIGYARPIPEKMQIFEDYLASLSVIKTIPYFSRFKLRKMLRAICLYRPGKRFTLDGPKAFALMLLVASRKQCQFGLANIFDVGFKSDIELFEFIKLVHSLQDSRNRAVHEGLTWDAKDDIESMKSQAYRIIEITQRIGLYLALHGNDNAESARA